MPKNLDGLKEVIAGATMMLMSDPLWRYIERTDEIMRAEENISAARGIYNGFAVLMAYPSSELFLPIGFLLMMYGMLKESSK